MSKMIIYQFFYKNYKLKKGEPMGVFVERRKDLRGKSRLESGLRWAKSMFGKMVRDKHAIFVVPHELDLKKGSAASEEKKKMIWSKEEFWKRRSSHYDSSPFSPSERLFN
jgi:hypothetical protein